MPAFDATAICILRLLNLKGVGPARVFSILGEAETRGVSPARLLEDHQERRELLKPPEAEAYLAEEETLWPVLVQLEEDEVQLLSLLDTKYPVRLKALLGKKAPPLLMVRGNTELLERSSVGFCGSRKASDKGLSTATDCAGQLAARGINVNSGYAAGVDGATHHAALRCGGTTTVVLAEGMLGFRVKKDLSDLWDWERICVVSEFLPGIPWSIHNAMQRNNTIVALSHAMILIEAGSKGGSIAAGRASLKMGVPLFAPVYEGMPESASGNRELLGEGARPLHKSKSLDRANMKGVLSAIRSAGRPNQPPIKVYGVAEEPASQLAMFEDEGK